MFTRVAAHDPLTQGDIIEGCPLVGLDLRISPLDLSNPPTKWWPAQVIVLTQACDLAQAKADSVVVATMHDAQKLVDVGVLKGPLVRDQVRRHLVYGWYFIPASTYLPESLIDLREVDSVPRVVLEELIVSGKRLAHLVSPFREHLAQHFAVTYMRVALPEQYRTQP